MFAIVRAGGRQEKVSVGDVISVDRVAGEPGSTISLPVLLLVDGESVTHDADALSGTT
ncbi:MAG: bL21 family ribosomal protein, partial [Actinobacteria bacterium]|nr:bL21 family ribosomal protein [Actinomycetota bacterium]